MSKNELIRQERLYKIRTMSNEDLLALWKKKLDQYEKRTSWSYMQDWTMERIHSELHRRDLVTGYWR